MKIFPGDILEHTLEDFYLFVCLSVCSFVQTGIVCRILARGGKILLVFPDKPRPIPLISVDLKSLGHNDLGCSISASYKSKQMLYKLPEKQFFNTFIAV